MSILILLFTSAFLVFFILETLFGYKMPFLIGLILSGSIILLLLILEIIKTASKNHVSRSKQLGILIYFEKQISKSEELTLLYRQALQIINNSATDSMDILAKQLGLPILSELKKSVFYNYFKCFYLCAETLALLNVYKQNYGINILIHPFNGRILLNYNNMSEYDEKNLTSYPWLIVIANSD